MKELVVATRSAHKLREIREILGDVLGLRLLDLNAAGVEPAPEEEGIEVFDTFRENALAKARFFAARAVRPVLADDSGLCVDALEGAPGVRSKRFAGRTDLSGEALDRANNERLLASLQDVPAERREAHYVCVVALADPSGREATWEGRCDGLILSEPRGGGGFGYDPLFWVPDRAATFGELDPEVKNRISHRAAAVRAAAAALPPWLAGR
jgi:XTP/dITP diphosphohydrolase